MGWGAIIAIISVIALIELCVLMIRANAIRRNARTTNDWQHKCSDCDCALIKILNNHERPYADWSQRDHG